MSCNDINGTTKDNGEYLINPDPHNQVTPFMAFCNFSGNVPGKILNYVFSLNKLTIYVRDCRTTLNGSDFRYLKMDGVRQHNKHVNAIFIGGQVLKDL